jgi:type IV pilus assembly protein PilW
MSALRAAMSALRASRATTIRGHAERGFTLVELMISILIALFLTGGLLTLVQAMKRTSGVQSGLSQLQDSERMAMTLIADVIQSAGYFPQPTVNTAAGEFPVTGPFTFAGQSVVGTGAFTDPAPGNTITVRYATGGTTVPPPPPVVGPDNTIDCTGNPSPIPTIFTSTFSIAVDPTTGLSSLACQLQNSAAGNAPTTVYLVGGVTQLQVLYGVQTNPAVNNGSADTYLDAATVTALGYWTKIVSVKITLTFVNPLYGNLAGQSTVNTPQTIAFTRIVDVMNKTGVT